MFSIIGRSLTLKLLCALTTVLAISFAGLSFFILEKQNSLLQDMISQVEVALKTTGKESENAFTDLESSG